MIFNEKKNVIKLPEGKRNDSIIQCRLLFIFKNCCYFEDPITVKSAACVSDFLKKALRDFKMTTFVLKL